MTPGIEYELVDGEPTGRTRSAQFYPTPRLHAVPPSKRREMPFEWPGLVRGNTQDTKGLRK